MRSAYSKLNIFFAKYPKTLDYSQSTRTLYLNQKVCIRRELYWVYGLKSSSVTAKNELHLFRALEIDAGVLSLVSVLVPGKEERRKERNMQLVCANIPYEISVVECGHSCQKNEHNIIPKFPAYRKQSVFVTLLTPTTGEFFFVLAVISMAKYRQSVINNSTSLFLATRPEPLPKIRQTMDMARTSCEQCCWCESR